MRAVDSPAAASCREGSSVSGTTTRAPAYNGTTTAGSESAEAACTCDAWRVSVLIVSSGRAGAITPEMDASSALAMAASAAATTDLLQVGTGCHIVGLHVDLDVGEVLVQRPHGTVVGTCEWWHGACVS